MLVGWMSDERKVVEMLGRRLRSECRPTCIITHRHHGVDVHLQSEIAAIHNGSNCGCTFDSLNTNQGFNHPEMTANMPQMTDQTFPYEPIPAIQVCTRMHKLFGINCDNRTLHRS